MILNERTTYESDTTLFRSFTSASEKQSDYQSLM